MSENNGKTLYLGIKDVYLQQILHGFKRSEYRERKDYYDKLLVEDESVDRPTDGGGWTRCVDGRWRRFKKYDYVRLKSQSIGTATYRILSLDCGSGVYVIRLGELVGREAGGKEKQ